MHFLILLCQTSMHGWKDSSEMFLNSVVTALLMTSTPSKWVLLMIPFSLGKRKNPTEQNQRNREVIRVRRCSSFRYFTNVPKSSVTIFHILPPPKLTCNHSNIQPTITTHHLLYLFNVDLNPACWRLPTSEMIVHLFASLFGPLLLPKTRMRDVALSLYTCWSISSVETNFFQTKPKISGLFVLQYS